MKRKLPKFLIFTLLVATFWLEAQTTTTLNLSRYNTLYETDPGVNISNGRGDYFFSGQTQNTNKLRRALLYFDLSTIPSGATITHVKLTLFMDRSIVGPTNVALHTATADWGQGSSDAPGQEGGGIASGANDASWNCSFSLDATTCTTSWTIPGGDFNALASHSILVDGVGSYEWSSATMIADVQNWVDNASTNFGWFVIGEEGVGTTAKRYEATNSNGNEPVLEVTYNALSVNEFRLSEFSITPNPGRSIVRLELPNSSKSVNVVIYDVLGKQIYRTNFFGNTSINVSKWDKGVYLVKISSEGKSEVKRFVKT